MMAPRKRKIVDTPTQTTNILGKVAPFHITFPFTLTHKEGRDIKICYFCAEEHLKSYLIRLKLKKGEYTIEPTKARNAS
jgi:hypothetical protein